LASRHMARRVFGGHVFPIIEGTELYHEYLKFFQATRYDEPMGIVEIEL
jgi:hypothetical protein